MSRISDAGTPPPGTMRIRRASPNPAGAFDELYLLTGAPWAAPVEHVVGDGPTGCLAAGERRSLRLFHFNDLHNYLTLPDERKGDARLFAQIVRRHRTAREAAAKDEIVLLVSGGDDHTGTVLDELLGWRGEELVIDPAYAAYSAAGVDIAALGNHELDRGADVLRAGIRANAAFPVLSANLHGSRYLDPAVDYAAAAIAVAKGLRIGFLGLITPVDTRTHSHADPGLTVTSPLGVLANLLPALAERVDAVVVMSHCGFGADSNLDGKAGAVRHLAEGDIALARSAARLTAAPVVIVGAHTHTVLNENGLDSGTVIDGVPIVQAGGQGSHLGEFELALALGAGRAQSAMRARLHRLVRPPGAAEHDEAFERAVIEPLIARVRHRLDEVLAMAEGDDIAPSVTLRQRYMGECALANFIADALVARSAEFAQGGVEIAIVNSTAIGAGLVPGGDVKFRDWYAVMPFADCLQVAEISGGELFAILDNNAKRIVRPEELDGHPRIDLSGYVSRGFLHFSAGLRHAIRLGARVADARAEDIAVLGAPLAAQKDRRFRVAFTNYLGAGAYGESWNGNPIGGGVPGSIRGYDLRPVAKIDTGLVFRNEIVAFIRSAGRIAPATGARIDGRLELR
ncbi:MAG TPA: 5'-nucleotidase C-terminal domain-containing protein [Alphaproteobacteria bacterium]|nr:5'-nucleotidase C-terminal domain-containing protein [Alphaproteobacteria bacterium]